MYTPNRVKDWLGVLNYQVIHCDTYALFPMSRYRAFWTWLENSLGSCASVAGSQYFIVARKRTYPIKPIKPHCISSGAFLRLVRALELEFAALHLSHLHCLIATKKPTEGRLHLVSTIAGLLLNS